MNEEVLRNVKFCCEGRKLIVVERLIVDGTLLESPG